MITAIRKKAQEISFALLRVAGYVRRQELADRIERLGYSLIEDIYSEDLNPAVNRLEIIKGIVALGNNIGEINQHNSEIILNEVNNLGTIIRQQVNNSKIPAELDVKSLFTQPLLPPVQKKPVRQEKRQLPPQVVRQSSPQVIRQNDAAMVRQSPLQAGQVSTNVNRQENILEIIRQSLEKKLQLKDILEKIPDASERTIRYDLVKLCAEGKLRREGTGGPSNFYVLQSAPSSTPVIGV